MADGKLDLDDVVADLGYRVEQAYQFMVSEFSQDWETAELYFAGLTDLQDTAGRSTMVKTEVRDTIRAIMPNVMRILLHARKPVVYLPSNIKQAAFVDQQSMWITQEFYKNGGYMQLYSGVLESLKMKSGPLKCWWQERPKPEYINVTGIPMSDVMQYQAQPDIVVSKITEHVWANGSPFEGSTLYDIEATRYYENGCLRTEAFPMHEFFVERNATNLEEYLHGHRREVTVGEAMDMGFEDIDFTDLDTADPEVTGSAEASRLRRGYSVDKSSDTEVDPLNKKFLLTEVYCLYDMDNDGVQEKYCFYLGGTNYKYLHHEQVNDFAIDIISVDPMPFTVVGRSITDIGKSSQDNITSLLRAMLDNAHMANNPRPAADPTRVDFNDLMNNAIGAPVKVKGDGQIQLFDIPFTAGNLLPVMQWMTTDSEQRFGVTRAARGLDPDAMQSTNKDAVMNTIQLSQGQIELMVRNIIETGLIPHFRKLLRLSIQHMSPFQLMKFKGAMVPVDISVFQPDLMAEPGVGLGTTSPEQKLQTLGFVYGEQQKYMEKFGLDNPFTSLSQVFNTIEDMIELGGLTNVGRYFNLVDKEAEKVIAEALAKQAADDAAKNQPVDPTKALMAIESEKRRIDNAKLLSAERKNALELQQASLAQAETIDLERDKMAQTRVIEFAKLRRDELNATVKREQDNSSTSGQGSTGGSTTVSE